MYMVVLWLELLQILSEKKTFASVSAIGFIPNFSDESFYVLCILPSIFSTIYMYGLNSF